MDNDTNDFVCALREYLKERLRKTGDAEYCTEAVHIADARGHLFRNAGNRATDESEDVFALRDLCRTDEDTLMLVPNEGRLMAVARNYF